MSPLTAVLKCPHYEKGHFKDESEGEAEAPSFTNGLIQASHPVHLLLFLLNFRLEFLKGKDH